MDFVVFEAPTKILFLKISYSMLVMALAPLAVGWRACASAVQLVPCFRLKHSYYSIYKNDKILRIQKVSGDCATKSKGTRNKILG